MSRHGGPWADRLGLAPLRQEWQRNARLRTGVVLALGLVSLWVLMALADRLDARVAERDRLAAQLQRLRAVAQDRRWDALVADMRVVDAQWRARLWREPTEGRMQAALQDWLRNQVATMGLAPRELAVAVVQDAPTGGVAAAAPRSPGAGSAPGPGLPPGLTVVRARVALDLPALRLHEWLARLASAPGLTRITRLSVSNADRPAVEVEIEALFRMADAATVPAAREEPAPNTVPGPSPASVPGAGPR